MMNRIESNRLVQTEGWVSIFINIALFAIKFWAGVVTGSIAIIADAWHTLSDSISSIIVVIGAKISIKPADDDHPFGHGRAELISSIVIGLILTVIALNFIQEAIQKLKNHEQVIYGTLAIVATIISLITKEGLAQYALWAWKKSGSTALKADAWHHRSDSISSVVILAGIFIGKHIWWIDSALGIIVALLIMYASYEIFHDSVNPLLGEPPNLPLQKKVQEMCVLISGMENAFAHHFHVHRYGDHTELTFHIKLPGTMSLNEAHNIASSIERAIKKELSIEATIHMEPIKMPRKS